jgi:hypothetical protein
MRTLLLVLAATLPWSARAAFAGPVDEAASTDPRLRAPRREVAVLESEAALARSGTFYLRLDVPASRLGLMLDGVALAQYEFSSLEQGVPQVAFVERKPRPGWDERAFTHARLEPARERDRIEIDAGRTADGASPPPPPVPKTAEESYSVPSTYRVVFAEGVSLEVLTPGMGGRNRSLLQRLGDAFFAGLSDRLTAVRRGAGERVRLRLTLSAEHAASLYRSLPPDAALVVVGLP